jgi:hypothetical protein
MFESHLKPPISFPTLTGSIVTFNSQYAGLPLKSHKVNIDSVSGVSAINIGSDNKYAGFITYNQLLSQTKLISSTSINGIDVTNNGDGSFTIDGTSEALFNLELTTAITVPRKSHKVLIRFNTLPTNVRLFVSGYGAGSGFNSSYFFYRTDGTDWTNGKLSLAIPLGTVFDNFRLWLNYYDLTVMFGETKADEIYAQGESGIEYFNSLFPNDYYNYNAGTLITVSAVNGSTNSFFTIPIGQTVNEATYNARTGILEATQPSVQTLQLPPCPIDTIEGVNNIWADTGDTTLQYPKFG